MRRSADNPPAIERRAIAKRIRLVRLMRPGEPGLIDWPTIARRLAEELRIVAARLAADPSASEADIERIQRSRAVVKDYDTAVSAEASENGL